jgi:hypothetical protein
VKRGQAHVGGAAGTAAQLIIALFYLGGIHSLADLFFAGLTWLAGLAARWLLWRPAGSAFFQPQGRESAA